MYAAIWRVIPGPLWLRISIATVSVGVIVTLLLVFAFPWVDTLMSSQNSSVG
jgi:hypothetical protein